MKTIFHVEATKVKSPLPTQERQADQDEILVLLLEKMRACFYHVVLSNIMGFCLI